MAHDALDTFTTDSNLVQNVTYTACWVQNGSTHGHVIPISICHFLINRTKNSEKNAASASFIPVLLIGPVMLHYFSSPLNDGFPFN